ncbi:MAG: valine--tRNA ligase [Pseudomonadota bacterium]
MLEKTYDATSVEPRIAAKWDEANAFAAGAGAKDGEDAYCIVIPPPNVTGSLHMGHALNNTLQDILIRFERMRGKDVLWQPGMDHAGIATQMVVERKLAEEGNIRRTDLGREAFLEKVWEWKAESGGTIFNQLKRLGASCDWSRERFTMDEGLSKAVLEVFVKLYEDGLIYRGKRLVNWDPHFETAISDLEVENTEVDGHMWHFKYPLAGEETYTYVEKDEDGNVVLEETRDYISIATTRPETMLGDGAVAVHPDDERYAPIVGKLCEIPVGPKEHRRLIPIITDEYPDPEFGSGAVKITGAHDFNDYQVAKRNDIPCYRLMDVKAAMREDGAPYAECATSAAAIVKSGELPDEATVDAINLVPDEYRGLDRFDARKKIIADIGAEGLAVMTTVSVKDDEGNEIEEHVPFVENKKIMQPFGDRSKVVIEPMLTDQWFADAKTLAAPAIASVREGRTNFVPKSWENTYYNWMENIEPWCISRQLWWGHQIPAWYDEQGNVFVAKTEAEAQAKAGEGASLTRDPDVLDTWFSSALWPFSTLGWPEQTPELARYYQTDVLVTGFDIIFFWVARMMMAGLHFMKDEDGNPVEPFHTVYVHALVRDKNGQKMSKSKGNVIDPLELIDEYGADSLRFTLAIMAAQGRDVKLDTDRVAGYRNFGTKLWNATRFAGMNGVAVDGDFDPASAKHMLNRWILTELAECIDGVTANIEKYRFNDAASALYKFVWNTFCDWYLELLKPVFSGSDEAAKTESQACAANVLDQIYAMLHPFMPFMTEELWQLTGNRDKLICHSAWPTSAVKDEEAAAEINWLIDVVTQIRSVRAEMNIKPSSLLALQVVDANSQTVGRVETHSDALSSLARLEKVSHVDAAPKSSAQIVVGEATYCLPLEGIINFAEERARLDKELKKLTGEIKRLEGKLGNEKFVANAPEAVVAEERLKLCDYQNQFARTQTAIGRIAE